MRRVNRTAASASLPCVVYFIITGTMVSFGNQEATRILLLVCSFQLCYSGRGCGSESDRFSATAVCLRAAGSFGRKRFQRGGLKEQASLCTGAIPTPAFAFTKLSSGYGRVAAVAAGFVLEDLLLVSLGFGLLYEL